MTGCTISSPRRRSSSNEGGDLPRRRHRRRRRASSPSPRRARSWSRRWPAASAARTCMPPSTRTRMVEMSKRVSGRIAMDLSRDVVFGHEFCCEVLDYGPDTERRLRPGARAVAMPVHAVERRDAHAPSAIPTSIPAATPSAWCWPHLCCWKCPTAFPAEHAALTEPLAVGIHAVEKAALARRRRPAGRGLRAGRARRHRRAAAEGRPADHRRRLLAQAARARRQDGRRHRDRSGQGRRPTPSCPSAAGR